MISKGPFNAFQNAAFRLLWSASLFSIVSFFMVIVARGWLVLELTDSPFMVTAINAVPMLPMLVLSPLGGVVADRLSRRLILLAGDASSFIILTALALLILFNVVGVWHVFVLSFLHGLVFAVAMPARMASVPDVVDPAHLSSGVALFTTIFSTAMLVGPAPAGFLIEALGMGPMFLIASCMLLPACGLLLRLDVPISLPSEEPASGHSILDELREALTYIRSQTLLLGLLVMGVVFAVLGMPYQAMLPVIARDVLHSGADGLGVLATAVGVGALIGSLSVAFAWDDQRLRFLMLSGGISFGILIVLFSISTSFLFSLPLAILLGLAMQVSLTSNMTVMQIALPSFIRGRVLSIRMVAIGIGPLGMLLLGVASEYLGPQLALGIMGGGSLVCFALVVWAFPSLRKCPFNAELHDSTRPIAGAVELKTLKQGNHQPGAE